MYILIAIAIFLQCANVYVMYFAETGPRIVPHIRSRMTPDEEEQTFEYVVTRTCFALSYLILGSMFVGAVALFCFGMRYYNATIGTRAAIAALYL